MPTIPFACNFCKEEIIINNVHCNPAHVIWCDACVTKFSKTLDKLGVQYDLGIAGYNVWGKPDNIAKLFDLMKQGVPTEKKVEEPEIITSAICIRSYYGYGDCTCNGCRISKRETNGSSKDPFGYKYSG